MADPWSWLVSTYSPIGALLADLGTKGPADRVGFAFGVGVPIVGGILALVRIAQTAKQRLGWENGNLRQELDRFNRERDRLTKDLEAATARLPETTLARTTAERRDGNEERAVALARIDEDGPDLAADVASYHLAMTDGTDDHLAAAERFATLSLHLDPRRPDGEGLLAEVRTRRGDRALSRGDLAATMRDWDEAFAYADPVEASPESFHRPLTKPVSAGSLRL